MSEPNIEWAGQEKSPVPVQGDPEFPHAPADWSLAVAKQMADTVLDGKRQDPQQPQESFQPATRGPISVKAITRRAAIWRLV